MENENNNLLLNKYLEKESEVFYSGLDVPFVSKAYDATNIDLDTAQKVMCLIALAHKSSWKKLVKAANYKFLNCEFIILIIWICR